MKCFDTYYSRFNVAEPFISEPPNRNLHTIVVIPSYNEPNIVPSLRSLLNCSPTLFPVEIIVVVNSPENAAKDIIDKNLETLAQINEMSLSNQRNDIKIFAIHCPNLPRKHAGVGFARKIGMDEAVRRFDQIEREEGIIINFDADSTCNTQYLSAIEDYFIQNPKIEAASIYFEHPLHGDDYPPEIYSAIAKYELYLRYYVSAQRYAEFPHAFHTIGSAFAIKADVYAAEGGMNRRKAGEDFYFLQKIIPRGRYGEIFSAQVYPSPRESMRVPFGTGASITKMCATSNEYVVYNPEAFDILKRFFATAYVLQNGGEPDTDYRLKDFLSANGFYQEIDGMISNSASQRTFIQRFFTWFDAFRLLKFLNFLHEKYINKVPVEQAAAYIAAKMGLTNITNNTVELLQWYRQKERGIL